MTERQYRWSNLIEFSVIALLLQRKEGDSWSLNCAGFFMARFRRVIVRKTEAHGFLRDIVRSYIRSRYTHVFALVRAAQNSFTHAMYPYDNVVANRFHSSVD